MKVLFLIGIFLSYFVFGSVKADHSGRIIIKFKREISQSRVEILLRDLGLHKVKEFRVLSQLRGQRYVLVRPTAGKVEDVVRRLSRLPEVEYAEPDYILRTQVIPNDPMFSQQWALHNTGQTGGVPDADIDAPEAWDITTGSQDVVVAVIDTGVDYNHEDLRENMWVNQTEKNGQPGVDDDNNGYVDDIYGIDTVNRDSDPMDDNGHGTHVAGIISARGNNGVGISGVSWGSKILAVKFLDSSGSGTTADAIEGIEYVIALRRRGENIVAINASWGGGGYSQALRDAIETAGNEGILFIAAAGNSSNDNDANPFYPASYRLENVISVAASDSSDNLASFSNYGKKSVHLAAPGVDVISTYPGGYQTLSGTSMAAPHVTGVVALIRSAYPNESLCETKVRVISGVDKKDSFLNKVVNGGRLNAQKALGNLPSINLSVDIVGGGTGSVVSNPPGIDCPRTCSYSFQACTTVTLTVQPASGNTFAGWGGDCHTCGMNTTCTLTLDRDLNCRVIFVEGDPLLYEDFETWVPNGWSVVNNGGDCVWDSTANLGRPNLTGGSGEAAAADSDMCGPFTSMNTSLISPDLDVSSAVSVKVVFRSDFNDFGGNDQGVVEVSTDGGSSWQTVFIYDRADYRGPREEVVDITPYINGPDLKIRFTYIAPGWHWWWQVDDVWVIAKVSAPDIDVQPTALDFGEVQVGESKTMRVTVSNLGDLPLEITAISILGKNPDEFSYTTDCLSGPVNPGSSCLIDVTFSPSSEGSKSANLVISSNDPDEQTVSVSLSGVGYIPDIEVEPASLDFGNVEVGKTATKQVTVRNAGSGGTITVTDVRISGQDSSEFSFTNNCTYPLGPGEECTVDVSFTPSSEGTKSATLEIYSDDPDEPKVNVSLTGNGVPPSGGDSGCPGGGGSQTAGLGTVVLLAFLRRVLRGKLII